MMYRHVNLWGLIVILGISILSGCGGASPTPILSNPPATQVVAPSFPTAVRPAATEVPPTAQPALVTTAPPSDGTDPATTAEGTATLEITLTRANPLDLPFLMKIDRVSVVVGRGTLLEGRVAHGTLQANGNVEILGPQDQAVSTLVLAVLVSGTVRDQVTVGDYAGILVESVVATEASPGMLLSEAGAYESYEEALQGLQ